MSTDLWLKLTNHSVVMKVIYDETSNNETLAKIDEYVQNGARPVAAAHLARIQNDLLTKTWFAWMGATKADAGIYYRIHSPVILIEFDHQRRVAPFRSREPTRDHIHAVIRTPNGNDYGKDLLRQHYIEHHHGKDGHEHH